MSRLVQSLPVQTDPDSKLESGAPFKVLYLQLVCVCVCVTLIYLITLMFSNSVQVFR